MGKTGRCSATFYPSGGKQSEQEVEVRADFAAVAVEEGWLQVSRGLANMAPAQSLAATGTKSATSDSLLKLGVTSL